MPAPLPLQVAALRLKKADQHAFDEFLTQFAIHTNEVTVAVTEADAGDIMTQKGRALHCRWLLRLFKECSSIDQPLNPPTPQ